jgi:DNA-directed RNA polymerase subunit M/transcription elongation factor TFIIS
VFRMDKKFCRKHDILYYYQCPECAKEFPDIQKIARDAETQNKQRQEHAQNTQNWVDDALGIKYQGSFEVCPDCGHRSLIFNKTRTKSQCNNPKCPKNQKSDSERLNNDWVF